MVQSLTLMFLIRMLAVITMFTTSMQVGSCLHSPPFSAEVNAAVVQPLSHKDSDDSEDDDEFVDVLEQLPLTASEGGQQSIPVVLGKRTKEPDDSDVSDISEKRVD